MAIGPRGRFTNDATRKVSPLKTSTSLVPVSYFARPAGSRFAIGIGAFAPYGLASTGPYRSTRASSVRPPSATSGAM
jgi:long-subunit fatty acid transport protein